MRKDDTVIAPLMQKVVLDGKDGIFLYRIVGIMDDGELDKDTEIFTDHKTDNTYSSIESDMDVLSEVDYFYGFPITKKRLEKEYPELDEKDRITEYYGELNRYVYLGIFDAEKDGIKLVQVWKKALQKMEIEADMKEFSVIAEKEATSLNMKRQKEVKEPTEENRMVVTNNTSSRINVAYAYREIKKSVIGQDETIRKVLSVIHTNDLAKEPPYRCRCLIVGKTGCGKTEILRNLSKITNRPFVRTDSTQITIAGYVGGSIESNIIMPLILQAGGNIELAQRGIVGLDEIDKKGSSNNEDVAGRGVLNSFLPFLDGTQYPITVNGQKILFDTSNLIVLASGAFSNVFDYNQKKMRNIGFGKPSVNKKEIGIEDFIKIGLMPDEFMGRFPILALMNELSEHDFENLLTQSKTSPLRFYERLFYDEYNISMKYYDNFIKLFAKKAHAHKLGARSLQKIAENVLEECKWEIMYRDIHNKELILTEETIENPKKFILK